jgi:hypothetical protein
VQGSPAAVVDRRPPAFSLFRRDETDLISAARRDLDQFEQRSRMERLRRNFAVENEPTNMQPAPKRRGKPPPKAHTPQPTVQSSSTALVPVPRDLPPLFVSQEATGERQRQQVMRWASDFHRHADGLMPPTMAVSAMYSQLVANTSHLAQPSSLRVATSFWLLGRVCSTLEVNADVIGNLLSDVRDGLFLPRNYGEKPKEEYSAAHLEALGLDPACGIHQLLSHKPFFESHTELTTRVKRLTTLVDRSSSLRESQRKILDVCARQWQFVIKGVVLRAWRGVVQARKFQDAAIAKFARRYDRRDRIQSHFFAWRFVTVVAAAERSKHQAAEGVDALAVNEAVTHQRVVELEDQQEEMKLTIARLKHEKLETGGQRAAIMKSIDLHVNRSEQWRGLTVSALDFLGQLKTQVTSIANVGGADLATSTELATRVVLGWASELVHSLPAGAKYKVGNFGGDLRDGSVYILLLHALSPSCISLECLSHKDVRRRFEVVLDAMANLGVKPPFNASELVAGTTDAHYVTLFALWWHFATPPTPSPETCLAEPGSFRDDWVATNKYLDACRAFYPRWFADRAVLAQLTRYVLVCRARGAAAKVVAADEEKAAAREMQYFSIEAGRKVPDVFLELSFMSAHNRAMNEEERERINHRVSLHMGLLRPVYAFYAGGGDKSGGDSPKTAGSGGGKKKLEFEPMDFIAFYRFCEDCRIVHHDLQEADSASPVASPTTKGESGATPAVLNLAASGEAPLPKLTKPQCYALFMDMYDRFASATPKARAPPAGMKVAARTGMRDAHLTPSSWVAACLRIAVLRHAPECLPLNNAPAPAASCFEQFLSNSVAPFACASSTSPFQQELWAPSMQDLLGRKRKVLIPFFEHYAGLDGNGTMDFGELTEALAAVGGIKALGVSEAVVRRTFAHLTGAAESEPTVLASKVVAKQVAAAAAVAEGNAAAPADAVDPPTTLTSPRSGDGAAESTPGTDSDEEDDAPAMVYGEFETLLVTMCVYADPAPHVPLVVKATSFLDAFCAQVTQGLKKAAKAPPHK